LPQVRNANQNLYFIITTLSMEWTMHIRWLGCIPWKQVLFAGLLIFLQYCTLDMACINAYVLHTMRTNEKVTGRDLTVSSSWQLNFESKIWRVRHLANPVHVQV